jgi:hypothetical protein
MCRNIQLSSFINGTVFRCHRRPLGRKPRGFCGEGASPKAETRTESMFQDSHPQTIMRCQEYSCAFSFISISIEQWRPEKFTPGQTRLTCYTDLFIHIGGFPFNC